MPYYNGKLIIITGFEGTGRCYWCGNKLPKNNVIVLKSVVLSIIIIFIGMMLLD